MKKFNLLCLIALVSTGVFGQKEIKIKKKDRKKDIEFVTNYGSIILRLSDSTPLHQTNFIRLVKSGYYDSTLFHRVINHFMIQGGDPDSKHASPRQPLGNGGPDYTIPAEFRVTLFHKKGALAAARKGDNVNPQKASSGSQFYIVHGKKFTDDVLNTLRGTVTSTTQREVYKTIGGAPHLDQNYTVFGEVVSGFDLVDKIAAVPTSKKEDRDRPIEDVKILKAKLRKRHK